MVSYKILNFANLAGKILNSPNLAARATATGTSSIEIGLGPVHTKAFSKVCVFFVIEISSNGSRPHYCFLAFSTVHAKKFENDGIARCDVS